MYTDTNQHVHLFQQQSSSSPAGWPSAEAVGPPPAPLPQGKLARLRAEGVEPLLSMPVFCFSVRVRHSRQHNPRDGDGAEHSWDRQQVQQEPAAAAVLPAKPPPEQLPRGMLETAMQVPLSPHVSGQPARDGEVGESRRVGARSETKCMQIQTSTYICSSSSPAAVASAACLFLLIFSVRVRHSRQHNTRDGDGAEHSWDRQQVQPGPAGAAVLPAKPSPEQLPRGMIETAAQVPLSPHPPASPPETAR